MPQPICGSATDLPDFVQKALTTTVRPNNPNFFLMIGVSCIYSQELARLIPGTGHVAHKSGVQLLGGGCLPRRRHSSMLFPYNNHHKIWAFYTGWCAHWFSFQKTSLNLGLIFHYYTRVTYSPVRVSTLITSPVWTK